MSPANPGSRAWTCSPQGRFDARMGWSFKDSEVASHDGVRVPLTIVHKRGLRWMAPTPPSSQAMARTDIPWNPEFDPRWLAWLERGGVYAVANVRGGGDTAKTA